MTASDSQIKPQILESDRIRDHLNKTALLTANSAQVVISLDPLGNLRAEMPGLSGAPRRKIDLPPNFAAQNPDLMAILQSDLARITDEKRRLSESQKPAYIDATVAREEYNRRIAAERALKAQQNYEALTTDQQVAFDRNMAIRVEKLNSQLSVRSREIWTYCAKSHSIQLANRVIQDPTKRPRKVVEVTTNGKSIEISPSNPRFDAIVNGTVQPKSRKPKFLTTELALTFDLD